MIRGYQLRHTAAALFAASVLGASVVHASPRTCGIGVLHDVEVVRDLVPSASTVHVTDLPPRRRAGRWGRRTYVYVSPSVRERTTYRVAVELDGVVYEAESSGDAFFFYDPTRLATASTLPVCVEGRRLHVTRPDGKTYKPRIVRITAVP